MAEVLKNLKTLGVGGTPALWGAPKFAQVTDAGLKDLKELKRLQSLSLRLTLITDAGLKELKELKSLQRLDLTFTQVTEAGVKELKATRPNLQIHCWTVRSGIDGCTQDTGEWLKHPL